ncbi:MAG: YceI family protein [Pseudomonadota bacterium]|nr:YceI family protein [Pseudomonadota bacterium]
MPRTALRAASAALTLIALGAVGSAHAQMAEYKIDPDHTYASFAIDHFGASVNRGRFDQVSGTVQFDRAAQTGKVDILIDTRSIHSGSTRFDEHLKAADLFNTAQHPSMRFVSDRLVFKGDKLIEAVGQLTLLGKTHPVTLKALQFNCYPNPMAKTEACGGDFEASIDRTQWGMNYAVDMGISKTVKITATIEAFKQ